MFFRLCWSLGSLDRNPASDRAETRSCRPRLLEERRRLEEIGEALFPLRPEERSREAKADPDADPTSRTILSCTIITCDRNEFTQDFHDRMPVVLDPKDYDRWLKPGDPQQPPLSSGTHARMEDRAGRG
jgi:hypothetical protein